MLYNTPQEGELRYFPGSNGSPRTALRGSSRQIYGTVYTSAHRQHTITQPKPTQELWLASLRSAILISLCDGGASRCKPATTVINMPGEEGENCRQVYNQWNLRAFYSNSGGIKLAIYWG